MNLTPVLLFDSAYLKKKNFLYTFFYIRHFSHFKQTPPYYLPYTPCSSFYHLSLFLKHYFLSSIIQLAYLTSHKLLPSNDLPHTLPSTYQYLRVLHLSVQPIYHKLHFPNTYQLSLTAAPQPTDLSQPLFTPPVITLSFPQHTL